MSISIKQNCPNEIFVNDKRVVKDSDGAWQCKEELTLAEGKAFAQYLQAINPPVNANGNRKYWQQQSNHVEP